MRHKMNTGFLSKSNITIHSEHRRYDLPQSYEQEGQVFESPRAYHRINNLDINSGLWLTKVTLVSRGRNLDERVDSRTAKVMKPCSELSRGTRAGRSGLYWALFGHAAWRWGWGGRLAEIWERCGRVWTVAVAKGCGFWEGPNSPRFSACTVRDVPKATNQAGARLSSRKPAAWGNWCAPLGGVRAASYIVPPRRRFSEKVSARISLLQYPSSVVRTMGPNVPGSRRLKALENYVFPRPRAWEEGRQSDNFHGNGCASITGQGVPLCGIRNRADLRRSYPE
jgi:hypothetical protein